MGVETDRFHLIAPYEPDARKWEHLAWIDQYSAKQWRGKTLGSSGTRVAALLKTYGDVVAEYAYHRESKSANVAGLACSRQTLGLLCRRHVSVASLQHIGKNSNRLEDVLDGSVDNPGDIYTEYLDRRSDDLIRLLNCISVRDIARRTGLARSTIKRLKRSGRRPCTTSLLRLAKLSTVSHKPELSI